MREMELDGHAGRLYARCWEGEQPDHVVLLVHGYGEHIGRYDAVADLLARGGAVVYGLDHVGHGRSEGERVLIEDFERVVDDVELLRERATTEHPDLPVALVGHSMGGMIAARYAQRYGPALACVVLSGPVLGHWQAVDDLLAAEEIPETPIDPSTLSRDPDVGAAYVADPLVWHGAFKRPTLEALRTTIERINAVGTVTGVPMLWLHGEEDRLVPHAGSATGWPLIAKTGSRRRPTPGPGTRSSTRPTGRRSSTTWWPTSGATSEAGGSGQLARRLQDGLAQCAAA